MRANWDPASVGEILEPAGAVPETVRCRARRAIAAHALDREDYRFLLEALGLVQEEPSASSDAGRGTPRERTGRTTRCAPG